MLEYSDYKSLVNTLEQSNHDNTYQELINKEDKVLDTVNRVIKNYRDEDVKEKDNRVERREKEKNVNDKNEEIENHHKNKYSEKNRSEERIEIERDKPVTMLIEQRASTEREDTKREDTRRENQNQELVRT